jgi:hypothetical protein
MKWRCRGKLAVAKTLLEPVERVFCHSLQLAIGVPLCHEPPSQVGSWIMALSMLAMPQARGGPFLFCYLLGVALRLSTDLEYRNRGSWGICQGLAGRDAADFS